MGSAIAANLQRAGFAVSGVDIDAQARERMRDSISRRRVGRHTAPGTRC
jgi:3-hydroxyacyl-CoA dehydrogenase